MTAILGMEIGKDQFVTILLKEEPSGEQATFDTTPTAWPACSAS
jgi:hypothetical protein